MGTPIVDALVTAYPTQPGFPTLSGSTDSSGKVSLALSNQTAYNFQFTSGAIGAVSGVFPPSDHTYTLYRLKNTTASTVPISVYPVFKYLNTQVGVSRGTSQFALPGNYSVSIPAGRGANFKSYKPGSLFDAPTKRSTIFKMPARDVSISVISTVTPVQKLRLNAIGGGLTSTDSPTTQYSSSANSWTSKLVDPTPREDYAGRGIGNVVYAIDGEAAGAAETAHNHGYSVPANTWSILASDLDIRRAESASVVGKSIYVIDGLTTIAGASKRIAYNHKFNTTSNGWTKKTSDTLARSNPVAGAVASVVYVAGGFTGVLTSSTTAYDVGTNTWSGRAKDLVGRANAAGGVLSSKLFVVGGRSTAASFLTRNDQYDPSANSWVAKADDLTARKYLGAAPMKGKLYTVDGATHSASGLSIPTNDVHAYDPSTDLWSIRAHDLATRTFIIVGVASK